MKCNWCDNKAVYDGQLINNKHHAYYCEDCSIYGINMVKLKESIGASNFFKKGSKEHKLWIKDHQPNEIREMIFDSIVEVAGPCHCLVEPDGCCQHGFDSWLIELGVM